jgi:malate/lactate dehydrogenase
MWPVVLAETNLRLCRTLVPQLLEVSPDAVLVMVTNPVDVLTYAAATFSGLPPGRVLGTGTVLDSSRLRDLLARHCGVAVQSVHAWIADEHGPPGRTRAATAATRLPAAVSGYSDGGTPSARGAGHGRSTG